VLVLTNASSRTVECGKHFDVVRYSCAGKPLDNHLPYAFRARLV
jgi:hypothetical protein